ncbi:MAG: LTA synthase family protein, partial [Muribaculaceae bacterium]|nr:LTA synthase family protein [Muribaculaceae bacterium]
ILPVLAFGLVAWLLRGKWLKGKFHLQVKIWLPVASLLMWVVAYSLRVQEYRAANCPDLTYGKVWTGYFELSKSNAYKFTQHLHRMGYVGYGLWQINNIFNSRTITDDERTEIEDYWAQQRLTNGDHGGTYAHNRGRNLIFIIIESLASDAVGMEVNGVQVTPNISKLIADDSTAVVMRHVVAQVNHGRSSDGQFIYNTGLLPLRNNVVAKRFPAANYPSIAKALGYPSAFEVIGERYTFYNHSTTSLSYGYHKLLAAPTSQMIPDEEVFANFLGEIKNAKTPFIAEMTTLETHDPYLGGADSPSAIVADLTHDRRDLNYLDRVREFDQRLGHFIEQLKESGIYDQSVIVLAADHEPRKSCLSDDGFISSDIFFAALNTGAKGVEIDRTVGQVDVFPTILTIMGVSDYQYPGLGVSPLTDAVHHGAQDAFGEVYGDPDASTLQRIEQAWRLSEIMIEGRYFK